MRFSNRWLMGLAAAAVLLAAVVVFAETWNEGTPASTESPTMGDDRIRELKRAMRERLAEDHIFESSEGTPFGTTGSQIGRHKMVRLKAQTSDPYTLADELVLYTKLVDTGTELFLRPHSDGTVLQLTAGNGGYLRSEALAATLISKTLSNPTLTGTITNSGTITGGTISGAAIVGGTRSGGTMTGSTLAGTTTNSGTISGGTISNPTISGGSMSGVSMPNQVNSGAIQDGQVQSADIGAKAVGISKLEAGAVMLPFYMSENDYAIELSYSQAAIKSYRVYIPSDATSIVMSARIGSFIETNSYARFSVAGNYSSTATYPPGTSWQQTTLNVSALSGWQTITVYAWSESGNLSAIQGYSFVWN